MYANKGINKHIFIYTIKFMAVKLCNSLIVSIHYVKKSQSGTVWTPAVIGPLNSNNPAVLYVITSLTHMGFYFNIILMELSVLQQNPVYRNIVETKNMKPLNTKKYFV